MNCDINFTGDKLKKYLSDRNYSYSENESLSNYCTFKIGGAADYIITPHNTESLIELIEFLRFETDIKFLILGNGSNVLFSDKGYRGAVILTEKLSEAETDDDKGVLKLNSGFSLTAAAFYAYRAGLTGLEFAYGIPGSIGGGVYMNAGAFGGQISDVCSFVTYYDIKDSSVKTINGINADFSYRYSMFSGTENVILSAVFNLKKGDIYDIKELMDANMKHRIEKQPLDFPNAGSVFKRCEGFYTSKLIEESGLKGFSVGGAEVSQKHSGFIINKGNATSEDVKKLIYIIKDTVLKKFNAVIECEIRIID